MALLFWQTTGYGKCDLVLLHGWGLNSKIWFYLIPKLESHFRLHLVDLPGYGNSRGYGALSIEDMAEEIASKAPSGAFWLGWSFGGLVAMTAALLKLQSIAGLITVASSPRFCIDDNWPGIKPELLESFSYGLSQNLVRTVRRFLILQTLGTSCIHHNTLWLYNDILSKKSLPSHDILSYGLILLRISDLRNLIANIDIPLLRLYGYLDNIVPHKVVKLVDKLIPNSQSIVFKNAAHAPFISHPALFCQSLFSFIQHKL